MFKGRILKSGIRKANPYIIDMPVAGDHIVVLSALDNLYISVGEVFEAKVTDQVALAKERVLVNTVSKMVLKTCKGMGILPSTKTGTPLHPLSACCDGISKRRSA